MIFKGFEHSEAEVIYKKIDDESIEIECILNTNANKVTQVHTEEIHEKVKLIHDEFKIDRIGKICDAPCDIVTGIDFRKAFYTKPSVRMTLTVITKWPLMKALAQLEEFGIVAKTYTIKEADNYEYCHRPC